MTPGPHDAVESVALAGNRWKVRCGCGKEFIRGTREHAQADHAGHFQACKIRDERRLHQCPG